MFECPHCKAMVDDRCTGRVCSQCGGHIYSPEFLQERADAVIRILRRDSSYKQFMELVQGGNLEAAVVYIRNVRGKEDNDIETLVIDKVINGPDILRRPAPVEQKGALEKMQPIPYGLVVCLACQKQISTQAETCPHCGQPTGVHVCPKCSSVNTKVISGVSKATSIFLWGPFAANKVISKFECKDCGHNW